VILNGGFGWTMFFSDVNQSEGGVFQVLRHLPHSYTILPDVGLGWRSGNAVTILLVTQRGFLLVIPLAAIVFTQWCRTMQETETRSRGGAGPESADKRPRH